MRRSSNIGGARATRGASASTAVLCFAAGSLAALAAFSGAPQVIQKRAPSGTGSPHDSQRRSSGAPHAIQNRASAGLSAEHAEQRPIGLSSRSQESWTSLRVSLIFRMPASEHLVGANLRIVQLSSLGGLERHARIDDKALVSGLRRPRTRAGASAVTLRRA